jgi:DHA2 family multidrug resistance protein
MTALQPTANAAALTAPAAPAAPAVSAKNWLAVFGSTLGAFMAVLNIQIVNASLADVQGAIGAGIDDGGWISTSYLIAEIVVIPLSAWLAQRVLAARLSSHQRSAVPSCSRRACALAQILPQMIVLRAMQGFSGGVLIPMAFTHDHHTAAKGKAACGARAVRTVGDLCARDRPDHRRLPHRELGLGIHFLRQLVPGAIMIGMLYVSLDPSPMSCR